MSEVSLIGEATVMSDLRDALLSGYKRSMALTQRLWMTYCQTV